MKKSPPTMFFTSDTVVKGDGTLTLARLTSEMISFSQLNSNYWI